MFNFKNFFGGGGKAEAPKATPLESEDEGKKITEEGWEGPAKVVVRKAGESAEVTKARREGYENDDRTKDVLTYIKLHQEKIGTVEDLGPTSNYGKGFEAAKPYAASITCGEEGEAEAFNLYFKNSEGALVEVPIDFDKIADLKDLGVQLKERNVLLAEYKRLSSAEMMENKGRALIERTTALSSIWNNLERRLKEAYPKFDFSGGGIFGFGKDVSRTLGGIEFLKNKKKQEREKEIIDETENL